jgi:Domain of unknown function (DUF4878)
MRKRFAVLTAFTLATAITLLTGCSKATSNSNSTNANTVNASASPTATITQPSATSTPITGNSGPTPADAFATYYEAIKRKDDAAIKNLFSKKTLETMEEQARKSNKTVDAVIKQGLEEIGKDLPAEVPKMRNEKVEGDKATLEVRDEQKDKWELVHFVKEDGQWKLVFDEK